MAETPESLSSFFSKPLGKRCDVETVLNGIRFVNEKLNQGVEVWQFFENKEKILNSFFSLVLGAYSDDLDLVGKTDIIAFLINAFRAFEIKSLRDLTMPLVSIALWRHLTGSRREFELSQNEFLQEAYNKQFPKSTPMKRKKKPVAPVETPESSFFPDILNDFFRVLESLPSAVQSNESIESEVLFLSRILEFFIDLLSQLPTRRYLRILLQDVHFHLRSRLSVENDSPVFLPLKELLDLYFFFENFGVNDYSGLSVQKEDLQEEYYDRVTLLQRIAFKYYPETLKDFALGSVVSVPQVLKRQLSVLKDEELMDLAHKLHLIPDLSNDESDVCRFSYTREAIQDIFLEAYLPQKHQLQTINQLPLIPNEEILWNSRLVPFGRYDNKQVLPLPKLNLQFLTYSDYLIRSFNLFRLESCHQIRDDLVDAVRRMNSIELSTGSTEFQGRCRQATKILSSRLLEVKKPALGMDYPSSVVGEVSIDLSNIDLVHRNEWDEIKDHEVVFVVTIRSPFSQVAQLLEPNGSSKPNRANSQMGEENPNFHKEQGLIYVRGGEVIKILDEGKNVLHDLNRLDPQHTISYDPAQYQLDQERRKEHNTEEIYTTFNLLIRRKSKMNNFKSVLQTIRDLMNEGSIQDSFPDWLHKILLGYGNPASASYSALGNQISTFDIESTILSESHALSSFGNCSVVWKYPNGDAVPSEKRVPPLRITYGEKEIILSPYEKPLPSPYAHIQYKENTVPFVSSQMEAIRSGMNYGLTLVVGPPGSGKTDVAVQIISNLYHNFPTQRTLVITHSNFALNDIFRKIMGRNIKPQHLLRLGMGAKDLDLSEELTRAGRIDESLTRRLELLQEVERLSKSLELTADFAYSCETAEHFYQYHIAPRIKQFKESLEKASSETDPSSIQSQFPFSTFFSNTLTPIFVSDPESDLKHVESCLTYITEMFEELREYRALELLRTTRQRSDYLLIRQARIIAMTCTHASLIRQHAVDLKFHYDNVIFEESAQISEIESFIPLTLQRSESADGCRLKRLVFIGDHHQLSPIIKSSHFQKYSHLDQSLFSRLIRLGVPYITLQGQGRSRSSLADLYRWRYKGLEDLPLVQEGPYLIANAGMRYEYQLVDVDEAEGEIQPSPWFYQNRPEARYLITLYQYLLLKGHPAKSITILTTYNGQKSFIKDNLRYLQRTDSTFQMPGMVTTVDKYQGQQNDIILLSLVRTRNVGHLRDIKRLVVAFSRARLGLYVFCKCSLFQGCEDLGPAFQILSARPQQLELLLSESYSSTTRKLTGKCSAETVVVRNAAELAQINSTLV